MIVNYGEGTVLWGYRLDCEAEGCQEKLGYTHSDEQEVRQLDTRWEYPQPGYRINRHAVKTVKRIMPAWEEATEEEILAAMEEGKARVERLSEGDD